MKRLFLHIVIVLPLISISCINDNVCNDCSLPADPVVIQLKDVNSGDNLMASGVIKAATVSLDKNTLPVNCKYKINNNQITIDGIDYEETSRSVKLFVGHQSYDLVLSINKVTKDCCSYAEVKEIKIEGQKVPYAADARVYTVFLDGTQFM